MQRRQRTPSDNTIPPPVPRPRRDSGFTWGLVGCGALLLIFVVGIGMAFSLAPQSNGFRKVMDNAMSASSNGERILPLRDAISQYRGAHKGAYPAKIQDLVPKYLPEETLSDLKGKDLEYSPPKPDSSVDFVVASVKGGTGEILGQHQTIYTRLLKDDRIVMDQVTRSVLFRSGASKPANPFSRDDNED